MHDLRGSKIHLVCTNKIKVENRETTHEPNCNEAIYDEEIWQDILWHSFQDVWVFKVNVDPRNHKHIYAQYGWCWYEHEKEPIITLQNHKKALFDDEKENLFNFEQ